MPWVERMNTKMQEMKYSNWIAQETRSKPANGIKLEICNLQVTIMCLLHYQNLTISVEHSATTTNAQKPMEQQQKIFRFSFLFDQSLYIQQKINHDFNLGTK